MLTDHKIAIYSCFCNSPCSEYGYEAYWGLSQSDLY